MAKPSKGKSKPAQEPVEETVDAAEADAIEVEEDVNAPTLAAEIVRETVVERKGSFLPLVLGGVVAAGLGVFSAQYILPNGLPFGSAETERVDLQQQVDTGVLDVAVGDLQAQIGAVVDNIRAIETRIAELEARPASDGISIVMENEMKELRAGIGLQKGKIAQMIDEAQDTKQSVDETARETMARSAVTRILVALDSGSPFDDALADVQANTDIAVPETLAQTAASGVPTLFALSKTYPDAARAALAAVRSEDIGGGVAGFFTKHLGIRSVLPREGDDPDAILSRVEAALDEGQIFDALAQADALPDAAQAPLADWMAQANLRLSAAREAEALATSLNSQ